MHKPPFIFSLSFSKLLQLPECFGVAVVFGLLTFNLMAVGQVFQFNPDEGIELSKVMLLQQGYTLYDQIWSDQPPLLTWILFQWLQWFGNSIIASRCLILCFSMLLIGTFYQLLRATVGRIGALIGVLGLCLSHDFLKLSVSVMRGLPAISLALLAVYLLLSATQSLHKSYCLSDLFKSQSNNELGITSFVHKLMQFRLNLLKVLLSGICFGLSLHVKLFTIVFIPALILQLGFSILYKKGSRILGWGWCLQILLWWSFAGCVTFLLVGYFTHAFRPEQLIGSHFSPEMQSSLPVEPSWLKILLFIAQDIDYVFFAGLVIWNLSEKRFKCPLFPVLWLMTVIPILLLYQPLWSHYYLLLSIPIVWLGVHGIMQAWPTFIEALGEWRAFKANRDLTRMTSKKLIIGFCILLLIGIPIKISIVKLDQYYLLKESAHRQAFLTEVIDQKTQTNWLFTDLPIFAFYTGIKIPPETVVFSVKRLSSGILQSTNTIKLLSTYQPEQLVLGRFPELHDMLKPYIRKHYVENCDRNHVTHYLRKSLPNVGLTSLCKG